MNEGGAGSGVAHHNTAPIPLRQSEYVSVGTRKGLMQNMDFDEYDIRVQDITKVAQKNYVPDKMTNMMKDRANVLKKPIDVLWVRGDGYHVMDGHHRYLAANALNMDTIPARVYKKAEKTMPDYVDDNPDKDLELATRTSRDAANPGLRDAAEAMEAGDWAGALQVFREAGDDIPAFTNYDFQQEPILDTGEESFGDDESLEDMRLHLDPGVKDTGGMDHTARLKSLGDFQQAPILDPRSDDAPEETPEKLRYDGPFSYMNRLDQTAHTNMQDEVMAQHFARILELAQELEANSPLAKGAVDDMMSGPRDNGSSMTEAKGYDWMLVAVNYLDSVKILGKDDYEDDGTIKNSAPERGASKALATKAKAVSKILRQAHELLIKRDEIDIKRDEIDKALDKLDKPVRTHARVKKEIGGSKEYKYHEKRSQGVDIMIGPGQFRIRSDIYSIFDGLNFSGVRP